MWLIIEPCGILCVMLLYILLFFSDGVITFGVILTWDNVAALPYCALYQVLVALTIWAHLRCMLSDPGAVPKDATELVALDIENQKICKKCNASKPARAHHCSICKRCIMKMDHHCPWVNNCVAEYNQKHFLLFLLYVFALSSSTICLLLIRIFNCNGDHQRVYRGPLDEQDPDARRGTGFLRPRRGSRFYCGVSQSIMLMGMMVFFIGLLFGLFTLAMLCDQISSLMQNQTTIEQLQNAPPKPRSFRAALQDVCGGTFTWRWLFPFPIKKSMRDVTY
eukprot:GEMP01039387.1.p1 GENE.GEMP01039387.1~~GEMP01039387.1.p1  ORF type:complete len:288 (+),score=37.20 GEMP01039387.1:32-865(+)